MPNRNLLNPLVGWRVCAAVIVEGKITHLMSLATLAWLPFSEILEDPAGFHVGTTEKFCTDYYTGLFDPEGHVHEVLLKLDISHGDLQSDDMPQRWKWSVGAEAVTTRARVLDYKVLRSPVTETS